MSTPKSFEIRFDDKPNLQQALMENPALVKEVIGAFVRLMDEAFDTSKGVQWAHLPRLLHKNLTFFDLIAGILRGAMDVKDMDPDAFDALGVEVHPLAMLSSRKSVLDPNKVRTYDWRGHWRVDPAEINHELVSEIVRKMFRYTRWIRLDEFAKALDSAQIATYKGLGHIAVENLPFTPALKYQREHFDDLFVGRRLLDTGFFDCGVLEEEPESCLACKQPAESLHKHGNIIGCLSCNAGWRFDNTN